MKRTIRRIVIFIGLVLAGAVIFFPYNQYAGDIKSMLEAQARQRGVVLEIEQISFGFPNRIGATGIAALLPQGRIKIPLWINSLDIAPRIWPMISGNLVASLAGKAYAGDLSGGLDWNGPTASGTVNLSGSDLKLELYPLFQAVGAAGTAAFSFQSGLNLLTSGNGGSQLLQPVGAKFELTVDKGSVPANRTFGPLLTIPEVSDLNLQTKLEQTEQTINVKTFKVNSSLGKVDATGTVHLTGLGQFDSARLTATIELTEAGFAAYGQQLLMMAQIQKPDPIYSWSASVDYAARSFPNIKIVPH